MPRNKYQRRRGLRPSTTAPSATQNQPFQHPLQPPHTSSSSFNDLGREAARQIREQNNPNTRFIDKPEPTTNKNLLRQAQARQEAASRSVQRQVLGETSNASLKPSGRYVAPSVPPRLTMQLVARGGAIRVVPVPSIGVGIVAAGAAYAIEQAAQPVIGWMAEKLARGIYAGYETVFGDTDGMTFDELQAHRKQIEQEYLRRIQRQQQPAAKPSPQKIKKVRSVAPQQTTQPERQQASVVVEENQTAPLVDERNVEYQRRRLALGDNPTKEQMDAVRDFGLDQHRINFPHLY